MGRCGRAIVTGLLVVTTGCAIPMSQMSSWQPLVDQQVSGDLFYKDRYECQQLADQGAAQSQIGGDALAGALLGAALGAALGGVSGSAGAGAMYGSILGTAGGAGSGAGEATTSYRTIFRNCLRGRGHQVLN